MLISGKFIRNAQAALVLVAAIGVWVFVPHEALVPLAVVLLALAVASVFAIKAYIVRLHAAAAAIESRGEAPEPALVLTPFERRWLGIEPLSDDAFPARILRQHQELLIHMGVAVAIVGLVAFLILVIEFSD